MIPRPLAGSELRRRLDHGWRPWLVHVGPVDEFTRAHVPGAIWVAGVEQLRPLLDAGDPVVLYAAGDDHGQVHEWSSALLASPSAAVWLYPGGLDEWCAAGRPVEP